MDTIQSYFTLIVTLETSFIVLCLMIACCDYSEAKPIEHSMPRWFLFFFGQDFSFLFCFSERKKVFVKNAIKFTGIFTACPWTLRADGSERGWRPLTSALIKKFSPRPFRDSDHAMKSLNFILVLLVLALIRVDEGKDLLKVVYGNIITNMVLKERSSNCLLVSTWFRIFIFKGIFVFPRKSNV